MSFTNKKIIFSRVANLYRWKLSRLIKILCCVRHLHRAEENQTLKVSVCIRLCQPADTKSVVHDLRIRLHHGYVGNGGLMFRRVMPPAINASRAGAVVPARGQ
jgi:hypothetical protein